MPEHNDKTEQEDRFIGQLHHQPHQHHTDANGPDHLQDEEMVEGSKVQLNVMMITSTAISHNPLCYKKTPSSFFVFFNPIKKWRHRPGKRKQAHKNGWSSGWKIIPVWWWLGLLVGCRCARVSNDYFMKKVTYMIQCHDHHDQSA